MSYSSVYPLDHSSTDGDNDYTQAEKLKNEIEHIYACLNDLLDTQVPTLLEDFNADTVDKKHATNTANNLPTLNSEGNLTVDTTGTAYNIPTGNVGGNIWIA
jgi:hypothetical protein